MKKIILLSLLTLFSFDASASQKADIYDDDNWVADFPGQPKYTQAEDDALMQIGERLGENFTPQAFMQAIAALPDQELSKGIIQKIITEKVALIGMLNMQGQLDDADEYDIEEEKAILDAARAVKK